MYAAAKADLFVLHTIVPTLQNCKLRPLETLRRKWYPHKKYKGASPCASAFLPSFLLLLLLGIAGLYATRPAQACPLAAGCHHPCCRAPLTSPPAAPPSALMWGSLAAAAVGAFAAEALRRKRKPTGERDASDYRMKMRAKKQTVG